MTRAEVLRVVQCPTCNASVGEDCESFPVVGEDGIHEERFQVWLSNPVPMLIHFAEIMDPNLADWTARMALLQRLHREIRRWSGGEEEAGSE
jgi:hypothetical protein